MLTSMDDKGTRSLPLSTAMAVPDEGGAQRSARQSTMKEDEPSDLRRRGHSSDKESGPRPLFDLGQVVGTPGALDALRRAEQHPIELLARHLTGDYGDLCEEDKEENRLSVERGFRVLSSYKLRTGTKVWVITEADRSVTTILLPADY